MGQGNDVQGYRDTIISCEFDQSSVGSCESWIDQSVHSSDLYLWCLPGVCVSVDGNRVILYQS